MTDPRRPSELDDPMRQGSAIFRNHETGEQTLRVGLIACARCHKLPEHLWGHEHAPVCNRCRTEILMEWGARAVAAKRKALGLDPEPSTEPSTQSVKWWRRPVPDMARDVSWVLYFVAYGFYIGSLLLP